MSPLFEILVGTKKKKKKKRRTLKVALFKKEKKSVKINIFQEDLQSMWMVSAAVQWRSTQEPWFGSPFLVTCDNGRVDREADERMGK